ncbi:MAG: MazG-like family protein [Bacillota bacterium]
MAEPRQGLDIARSIKIIEWLKTELLGGVANLSKAMIKNSEELILDALAGVIMVCYLLARRMGISFTRLDEKVREKVEYYRENKHEVEIWYGDLTYFYEYLRDRDQFN